MTTYQVNNQSDSINKIKAGYGGSDKTSPSFLRPQHVSWNSPSKAKDLGTVNNLYLLVNGDIGSEVGTNSLFFKVKTSGKSDIQVVKNSISKYHDKEISVGILNEDLTPRPLTVDGYAYRNEVINTEEKEFLQLLDPGTYYFTISCSSWKKVQYSVTLSVLFYKELTGKTDGEMLPYGRLAMAKLDGEIPLTASIYGLIPVPSTIKEIDGKADGTASPSLTLAPFRGSIVMAMSPYGRIKATWRISGSATGTNANTGTLTVTSPGGGY